MKKLVLNFLLLTVVSFFTVSDVYGGLPIQDKQNAVEGTRIVLEQKEKPVSKLKQKIAQKVIKKVSKKHAAVSDDKLIAIILAIILPFVGVAVWQNEITKDFWIALLLWLLFYLPGLIYALYIILG